MRSERLSRVRVHRRGGVRHPVRLDGRNAPPLHQLRTDAGEGHLKPLRDIVRDLRARGLWEPAKLIADKHRVNIAEVLMRKQQRPIAFARHEIWAHAHDVIPSYPLLGEIFDRDQSAISAGVRAHRDRAAIAAIDGAAAPDPETKQLTLWNVNAATREP